jgi:nucleoside-diphosphate-sugar epimerase
MNSAILGCGYVGSCVARRWREDGHNVTVTTTTSEKTEQLKALAQQVVVMRGSDEAAVRAVVRDQQVVLICVAPTTASLLNPEGYEEIYLRSAKNLVAALKDDPAPKQIIHTSSCSIYGDRVGQQVDEGSPVAPMNRMTEILCETEQILLGASDENVRVCVLRLGGIYGSGPEMANRLRRIAGAKLPGNGENLVHRTHIDDIVSGVEFARQNQLDGIYNLVNDVAVPIRGMLDSMCEEYGLPKVVWDPSMSSRTSYNARVSNSKLKAAGYRLIHPE